MRHPVQVTAWMVVCATLVAAYGDVSLVDNGKPVSAIVLAADPTPLARHAAAELAEHIQKMSGAPLPVVSEDRLDRTQFPSAVFVGDTARAAAQGVTTTTLEPEEIVIRTLGPDLLLLGGDRDSGRIPPSGLEAIGTLYAVYELLEGSLGVRWLWPGEQGTVIPQQTSIRVEALDRRFQPPLIQRNIRRGLRDWGDRVAGLGLTAAQARALEEQFATWTRRRRLGRRANFRFGHAYNNWLKLYGREHPDWFAMMPDGTRVTPDNPYPNLERAKLCVTNPELLDFIVQKGKEYLAANPGMLSFSACPNDSRGYCMCPTCKALDPPEGMPTVMNYPGGQTFMYPSLSDRYVWFWNQLAQRLGDAFPGRYIGAYAYSNYNHPPLREKLSSRVIIAYVGFNYLNAAYSEQSRRDWAGWADTGCKLYLRPNLLLVGHGFPLNYAREFGRDLKTCFQTGMLGTDFDSMTHHYAAQAPIFYLLTALLWNPERDIEEVLAEFMEAAYGPAAPAMHAYWDRLETLTSAIANHTAADGGHDTAPSFDAMVPEYYDDAVLRDLRGLLHTAAAAAAPQAACGERIRIAGLALDYAEIQRNVLTEVKSYVATRANLESLSTALERKQDFFAAHLDDWTIGLHHVYWREARSTQHRRMYGADLDRDLGHPRKLTTLPDWKFRTDPQDVGTHQRWFAADAADQEWKNVTCFTFWEQQGFSGYDGYGWYRTTLTIEPDWPAKGRLFLRFGAVDESFQLYVDGKLVHESLFDAAADPDLWKKPRLVDLSDHLRPGKHLLAVRVHDSGGAGGLWKPVMLIYE